MRFLLLLLLIIFSVGCLHKKDQKEIEIEGDFKLPDTNFHEINEFGRIRWDTSKFIRLKCGLYLNNEGIVAYKTINQSYRDEKLEDARDISIYIATIYGADPIDTIDGGQKEMRYVVDTSTFQILGTFYFRDKNHFYDFNPMSDGGTIGINNEIDSKSFRILESEFFGVDYKHCFYRGRLIEGADLKTFKVLDTSYSFHTAFDKRNFYEGANKITTADVQEQNLDSIRKKKHGL